MFDRVSPVDGKAYAISFEMRLPLAWNGRFFHQGNGGIDGAVVTATGTFGGGPTTGALMQGFAVLSSDAGHNNAQGGPAFGIDPQARLDYGYQAVGKLTPMAKQAIAAAYGKGPDRSYFGGCSNGGRHTLIAAARYADEYDGYLAGAPGYNLPLAALANIFGAQRYAHGGHAPIRPRRPAWAARYTTAERTAVSNAVLARCDALDGASDGMIQDTRACQRRFNFMRDVPTCGGARDGTLPLASAEDRHRTDLPRRHHEQRRALLRRLPVRQRLRRRRHCVLGVHRAAGARLGRRGPDLQGAAGADGRARRSRSTSTSTPPWRNSSPPMRRTPNRRCSS